MSEPQGVDREALIRLLAPPEIDCSSTDPYPNVLLPHRIDLRDRASYVRAHVRGAVCVPAGGLSRSLFLLPPRTAPLLLLASEPEQARGAAQLLTERGWEKVRWFDGRIEEIDAGFLESGMQPNRLWEPSPFLLRVEPLLPREGSACDLACGSGRNAVFLAVRGRDVLGVDLLPDALAQARLLARAACIAEPGRARFRRADLTDAAQAARVLVPGHWSVLTCFRYLDRALLPRLPEALAPGGVLVYETFLEEQARVKGKPSRPEYLLRPGELREVFAGLEILEEREGPDAEGNRLASIAVRR